MRKIKEHRGLPRTTECHGRKPVVRGLPCHISSGGVVIKKYRRKFLVLILFRKKTNSYHLPKGTVRKGETLKDAAKREICEETGMHVEIVKYLGKLKSRYKLKKKTIPKITHYFLTSLDAREKKMYKYHDHEHDKVFWKDFGKAYYLLKNFKANKEWEKEEIIIKKIDKLFKSKEAIL